MSEIKSWTTHRDAKQQKLENAASLLDAIIPLWLSDEII